MNAREIRQWGEEVGRKYPKAHELDRGYKPSAWETQEGIHNDNFGLAILQIQATLELAAQVAELEETVRDVAI